MTLRQEFPIFRWNIKTQVVEFLKYHRMRIRKFIEHILFQRKILLSFLMAYLPYEEINQKSNPPEFINNFSVYVRLIELIMSVIPFNIILKINPFELRSAGDNMGLTRKGAASSWLEYIV